MQTKTMQTTYLSLADKRSRNPHLPTIDAKLFSWTGRTGTCEASDLKGLFLPDQVWPDACDSGFLVLSPRTGNLKLFLFDRELRGHDGELLGWAYREHLGGFEVHVFND